MAKAEPKKPSVVLWVGIIAAVIVIYVYASEEAPPVAKKSARPVSRASATSKSGFLPVDYTAKFASVTTPAKNAFKPLVMKTDLRSTVPTKDNGIPVAFTGGEPNWIFTGSATVDGTPRGLLENTSTGEGVFLVSGERWKTSRVLTITKDEIVMQGPEGDARTIKMETEDAAAEPKMASVTPLPLPLPGQLGAQPVAQGGNPGGQFTFGQPGAVPGAPGNALAAPAAVPQTLADPNLNNNNQRRRRRGN